MKISAVKKALAVTVPYAIAIALFSIIIKTKCSTGTGILYQMGRCPSGQSLALSVVTLSLGVFLYHCTNRNKD